jgi:hypothetical protein
VLNQKVCVVPCKKLNFLSGNKLQNFTDEVSKNIANRSFIPALTEKIIEYFKNKDIPL